MGMMCVPFGLREGTRSNEWFSADQWYDWTTATRTSHQTPL